MTDRKVTYTETVRDTCATCGGEGFIEGPSCSLCLRAFDVADIEALWGGRPDKFTTPPLPCGHPWRNLNEERLCPDCEGTGAVTTRRDVTAEVEALRGKEAAPGK